MGVVRKPAKTPGSPPRVVERERFMALIVRGIINAEACRIIHLFPLGSCAGTSQSSDIHQTLEWQRPSRPLRISSLSPFQTSSNSPKVGCSFATVESWQVVGCETCESTSIDAGGRTWVSERWS